MGCVQGFSIFIFIAIIYHIIKSVTKSQESGSGGQSGGAPATRQPTPSRGTTGSASPLQAVSSVTGASVQIQNRQGRNYARIQIPLQEPLPDGLVVQSRSHAEGSTDTIEETFDSVFVASGRRPDLMASWATLPVKHTLVQAWAEAGGGFWLKGNHIYADIPVSSNSDPKINMGIAALGNLASSLHTAITSPSQTPAAAAAPVAYPASSPSPAPPAPAVTPASHPPSSTPAQPDSQAPEGTGSVGASALAGEESSGSGGGSESSAFSSSLSSFSSSISSSFGGAGGSKPSPESLGPAPDLSGAPAVNLMKEVLERGEMGPKVEGYVKTNWAGKILQGRGLVDYHQRIFGTDMDFGVSGGTKLTVKLDLGDAGGLMPPKVVLHLPDVAEEGLRSDTPIVFSGKVLMYRPALRSLLVSEGRVALAK